MLSEMNDVLNTKLHGNKSCYFMYRNCLESNDNPKLFSENNLRYDITIIPPILLSNEYNKTYGHYHPKGFGEVYEVLDGKALFVLQRKESSISEFTYIYAKKGEVLNIPSGYGHVTINPTKNDTLVLANIVSNRFNSLYQEFKEKQGAMYYYTMDGWLKNDNYIDDIKPEEDSIENLRWNGGLPNIYNRYKDNSKQFMWLHNSE